MPTTTDKLLSAALRYGKNGWAVFPCNGKRPYTPNGYKDATKNPEQIERWWRKWPNANIGFVPGSAGLLVVDVDGPEGEKAAQGLGLLAEPTMTVKTSRGFHLYYRHPGGDIGNASVGPGLDVRADAGYVLLPPSRHPNGPTYTIERDTKRILVPLPPKALEALQNGDGRQGVPFRCPETVPEGCRNDTLYRLGCALRAKGLEQPEINAAILEANSRRCVPPLPESDLWDMAARICDSYEAGESIRLQHDVVSSATHEPPTGRSRVAPLLIDEIMGQKEEPPDWVIPGYAARQEVSLWTGKPKVGKTTLMRELALRAAHGGDFLGRGIKSVAVLWWNLEESPRRCRQRFREMARVLGIQGMGLRLHIMSARDKQFDWGSYCKENDIDLTIIDSLAKQWNVENVNDSTQTERAVEAIRVVAEWCNMAVVLIYHDRKSGGSHGEGVLGSTQILTQVDYAISMERVQGGHESRRELKAVSRDDDTPTCLVVELNDGLYRTLGTGAEMKAAENKAKVLTALTALGPDQRIEAIADATGDGSDEDRRLSVSTVGRVLKELLTGGEVTRTGKGGRGDPFVFSSAI